METILFIHHGSGLRGGASRSVTFLIDKLINKEVFKPHILCMSDRERNKKVYENRKIEFIYKGLMKPWHGSTVAKMNIIRLVKSYLRSFFTYFGAIAILKKVKPDIVHLNSTCLFICAKAIKHYDKNIIVICHIREPLLPNFYGDILKRNCNKYVDQFIAIGNYEADSLKPTKVPTEVIYNFVDFNNFNTTIDSKKLRIELNLKDDDVIFLYLARVVEGNGALELLQTIVKDNSYNRKFHFCIVGISLENENEYTTEVIELAKRRSDNIHLIECRTDIPEVIASSDVLIVPYQEPHQARSIIEAGAMGVPAIVSDIGCINELVVHGETGWLFDYQTFEKFKEGCELLGNNPEIRRKMGNSARIFAEKNFDSDVNSERVFTIYEKLLSSKRN